MRSVLALSTGWAVRGFLGEEWALHRAALHSRGDASRDGAWTPARVPGSVLADLVAAGQAVSPYRAKDSRFSEWVAQRTWVYRREISVPALGPDERVFLEFDGIDASATICMDGAEIARHDGMHVPAVVELRGSFRDEGEHLLAVVVDPVPVSEPQVGRTSRVRVHKGRMGYGWDFCPRILSPGLWAPVRMRITGGVRLADVWARTNADSDIGALSVVVALDGQDASEVRLTLADPGGSVVATSSELPRSCEAHLALEVPSPHLWNVNGTGEACLYRLTTAALSRDGTPSDVRDIRVGFRDVVFRPSDRDDSALSYQLVVNGHPVYLNGWNWVPVDALYGAAAPARLRHLLGLARDAGVVMLRVWGGGLIETEQFYDICDELGILVWQEFAQSSSGMESLPSEDPSFVALMRREAEAIIPTRRNHPSLAIWCGGNELQRVDGTPLSDADSPVLAALRDVVHRLDPDRHWLPSSPSGPVFANTHRSIDAPLPHHDVHGPWEHQGLGEQYRLYDRGRSLLLSEFGVEGMSNLRSIRSVVPQEHLHLPTTGNPVWDHVGRWWNNERLVREAFGDALTTLEELERASQFLQADGLRYAVEANRRRHESCGVLPWQLNESFPNGWCTSAVDYFGEPKAVFHAVRRAYRPLHVCAQLETAAWGGRCRLSAGIWAWQSPGPLIGTVSARVVSAEGVVRHEQHWEVDATAPISRAAGVGGAGDVDDRDALACRVGQLECALTGWEIAILDLTVKTETGEADTRQLVSSGTTLAGLLHLAPASVEISHHRAGRDASVVTLRHCSGPVAPFLRLLDARPASHQGWAVVDDGGVDLLPGETRHLNVRWDGVAPADRRLRLDGWNASGLVGPPVP